MDYNALSQTEQAIAAYKEALRLNPEYAVTWLNLGINYGKMNKYEQANQAFLEAIRIEPEYADAWGSLGSLYARQGLRDKVLEVYSTLKKLDSSKAEIFFKTFILP